MTSLERVKNALNFEEVDRLPVIPQLTYAAAFYMDMGIDEALEDPVKQKVALLNSQQKGGYDGIYAGWEGSFVLITSSFGINLKTYPDKPPSIEHPLIRNRDDLENLPRLDPDTQGRIPLNLQLIRELKSEVKDIPIMTYVPAPFTLSSLFLGVTDFMITLMRDKMNILDDLLQYAFDTTLAVASAKIKSGVDMITIADPSGSTDMVSPKLFEKYSFPLLQELITKLKQNGVKVGLHICGQTKPILPKMIETGADYLEIDSKVDLVEAQKMASGKTCVVGNINSTDLAMGTPKDIKTQCTQLISKMSRTGFILSSGCEIGYSTPLENIKAMIKSVKEI